MTTFPPRSTVHLPEAAANARIPSGFAHDIGTVIVQEGNYVRVSVRAWGSPRTHKATFTVDELEPVQPPPDRRR